eukprot:Clim_evm2s105 gene=Clim_evmTU2s105
MMLSMQTSLALLATILVAEAAPATNLRRQAPAPECPALAGAVPTNIWDIRHNAALYESVSKGILDISPVAMLVNTLNTDLEAHMVGRMGNFEAVDREGAAHPFASMLYKLNALTAPILMAPYFVQNSEKNSAAWDAWWNALQELTPAGELEAYCHPDAQDPSYVPRTVAFPLVNINNEPLNAQYSGQTTGEHATSIVWDVRSGAVPIAQDMWSFRNLQNQCQYFNERSFSETFVEVTQSTPGGRYVDASIASEGVELSGPASNGFLNMDEETSSAILYGVEQTAARSTIQGNPQSEGSQVQIEFDASFAFRPNTVTTVTTWIDQTHADISFTGDVTYDAAATGIQAWIQGNGMVQLGDASEITTLLSNNKLTTPDQIRNVAELAMNAIGAEWSETFLNSLVSSSVIGAAHSRVGRNMYVEIWECDANGVEVCNEAAAEAHPPSTDLCNGRRAMEIESDCHTLEPVDGHSNRWLVLNNCDGLDQAN